MAGITISQAESQLATWLSASTATAAGQSVTIDGKTITRTNAREIQSQIVFWDTQIKRLTRGGMLVRGGSPV